MDDNFEVIVTVSRNVSNENTLSELVQAGASIFRLNGAHNSIESLSATVDAIRRRWNGKARLMVDLPGRKVRTRNLNDPIPLKCGGKFQLYQHHVTYSPFLQSLQIGEKLLANDGLLHFEVLEKESDHVVFRSENDGLLENNKGLSSLNSTIHVPPLLEYDYDIISLCIGKEVDYLALSYVRSQDDVIAAKKALAGSNGKLITKIETRLAVINLPEILNVSDTILIDRGDLAAEIGLVNVPMAQNWIIQQAHRAKRRVFLATQFVYSMINRPIPLIAEIDDIHTLLGKGIHGIQLSEETAIGKYPVEAVRLIRKMRDQVVLESSSDGHHKLRFSPKELQIESSS